MALESARCEFWNVSRQANACLKTSAHQEGSRTLSTHPFRYHRAETFQGAFSLLSELGDDAKILAGGQSLIPLMKLRFARPGALVDLSFVSGLSYIEQREN